MGDSIDYQSQIDTYLADYLLLLDEYTTLRSKLSTHQACIYQNIARANFAAERGLRYGRDQYDERMQASRRLAFTGPPSVSVVRDNGDGFPEHSQDGGAVGTAEPEEKDSPARSSDDTQPKELTRKNARDPLRWFGVLTPAPLRAAQTEAIAAVERVIPRLVEVNAEMERLEIEVRRARKRRNKEKGKACAPTD